MTGVTQKISDLPKDRIDSVPLNEKYTGINKPVQSAAQEALVTVASQDVEGLLEAERNYGESWCKRGGVGAFMNCTRKWDRLEQMLKAGGDFDKYDIFTAIEVEVKAGGEKGEAILDAVRDLRRYLLLVEAKMLAVLGDLPLQRDNIAAAKVKGSFLTRISQAIAAGGIVPEAALATDQTRAVDERVDNTGQENVRGFTGKDE
jgi:hypothetical protein